MKPVHVLMAVAVAAIWGFNFVAIRWGLDSFPPILMVPRPRVPVGRFFAVGTVWFVAQFALLFIGMRVGMPPGLASVIMQSQAFFTVLLPRSCSASDRSRATLPAWRWRPAASSPSAPP